MKARLHSLMYRYELNYIRDTVANSQYKVYYSNRSYVQSELDIIKQAKMLGKDTPK